MDLCPKCPFRDQGLNTTDKQCFFEGGDDALGLESTPSLRDPLFILPYSGIIDYLIFWEEDEKSATCILKEEDFLGAFQLGFRPVHEIKGTLLCIVEGLF